MNYPKLIVSYQVGEPIRIQMVKVIYTYILNTSQTTQKNDIALWPLCFSIFGLGDR